MYFVLCSSYFVFLKITTDCLSCVGLFNKMVGHILFSFCMNKKLQANGKSVFKEVPKANEMSTFNFLNKNKFTRK